MPIPLNDPSESGTPRALCGTSGTPALAPGARILCLKLDHIGDMLIAAPALMLLRKSFAAAHITLLCAPWNVGLARRLGVADEIHAVSFFAQNSLEDEDRSIAEARRAKLVADLQGLRLAPFDLAIDLRRDEDTRELLKVFDARILAGFGDLATFSYLDVALPFARHGPSAGASTLRLLPNDLKGTIGHHISDRGLHLSRRLAEVHLRIETDTVWPPSDDGEPDTRMLGAALWRIDVGFPNDAAGSAPSPLPRDGMLFGAGWLDWEPWGRWSNAAVAHVALQFPAACDTARLEVRVQGHTSSSHPAALVRLITRFDEVAAERRFAAGEEPATIALTCRPQLLLPTVRSEPFLMRGGRYGGVLHLHVAEIAQWRPLRLSIRGARLGHVLARLDLPERIARAGNIAFPFEIEIKDAAEPILIQIETDQPDHDERVAITSLELNWLQGGYPELPSAHMETQLTDLAAMVALRYAPDLIKATDEISARLTRAGAGSSATAAVSALKRHKNAGWPFRRPRKIIGIAIGANKETKLWPIPHFAELCRNLLSRTRASLVFIGGPQEAEAVKALGDELAAPDRLIDLCACCRIEDLGEVLGTLDGFIGLDTGTTHFAGRVGIPTVAIFGAAHDPREWGPVGETSGWAVADMTCANCFLAAARHCPNGVACMSGITPETVWQMVAALIPDERTSL